MKITGIILVVVVALNIISWIGDAYTNKGKVESPIYYIFIIILFVLGIWLIKQSKEKKRTDNK